MWSVRFSVSDVGVLMNIPDEFLQKHLGNAQSILDFVTNSLSLLEPQSESEMMLKDSISISLKAVKADIRIVLEYKDVDQRN